MEQSYRESTKALPSDPSEAIKVGLNLQLALKWFGLERQVLSGELSTETAIANMEEMITEIDRAGYSYTGYGEEMKRLLRLKLANIEQPSSAEPETNPSPEGQ